MKSTTSRITGAVTSAVLAVGLVLGGGSATFAATPTPNEIAQAQAAADRAAAQAQAAANRAAGQSQGNANRAAGAAARDAAQAYAAAQRAANNPTP